MDYHEISTTLYAYLYKGTSSSATNTLVATRTFNLSTTSLSNEFIKLNGNKTATFNILLEQGYYYEVRTGIGNFNSSVDIYDVNDLEPSDSLHAKWFTPKLNTPTVRINAGADNQFTEICRGGFQVVSSANKKIIAEIDSSLSTPALSITGNLSVTGDIDATGNVSAYSTSDLRLKEDIKSISNALDKVNQINGVTFNWKKGFTDVHKFEGEDVGVIAQEIESVLPEIVNLHNKTGYRGVKYEKLTPLLIEAIKELSNKVEELENKIKRLE